MNSRGPIVSIRPWARAAKFAAWAHVIGWTACVPGDPGVDAGDVGTATAVDASLDTPPMAPPDSPINDNPPDAFAEDASESTDAGAMCESCSPPGLCQLLTCDGECVYTPVADGADCMGDVCVEGSCVPRTCGDGWREDSTFSLVREACDDGNVEDGDACSPSCVPTVFVVEETEDGIDFPPGPRAAAAIDASGAPLYVWTAAITTDSGAAVRARRFEARGGRADVEASLAIAEGLGVGVDPHPVVTGLLAGGWVVAWEDRNIDGSDLGIAYRFVSSAGIAGPAQRANLTTRLRQHQPSITPTLTGFAIAWSDESGLGRGDGSRVVMRTFTTSGPTSDEIVVSAPMAGDSASEPMLGVNAVGRALVVWTLATSSGREVRAEAFDGVVPVGSSTAVDDPSSEAHSPNVIALSTGDFAVAWARRARDGGGDIRARVFAAATGTLGPIDIDTGADMAPLLAETEPSLAALPLGGYLVSYTTGREDTGAALAVVGDDPPELALLLTALEEGSVGDVSLAPGASGIWVSFGRRGGSPVMGPLRGVYGFYLPRD